MPSMFGSMRSSRIKSWPGIVRRPQPFVAGGCGVHQIAGFREILADGIAQGRVVLDEQQSHGVGFTRPRSTGKRKR